MARIPDTSSFQIPFIRIAAFLEEHNITATDHSGGIVTLKRFCASEDTFDFLKKEVRRTFKEAYSSIEIDTITLHPQSSIPLDFDKMVFEGIRLSSSNLRSAGGTFSAFFRNDEGRRKTLYFRYHVDATLLGYKAKHNLSNGKILTSGDVEPMRFQLESLSSMPLQEYEPETLVVKQYVREGTVLLERQFDQKLLVGRRTYVDALMQDGGLVVGIRAQALDGGNKGDTIRIRTNEGKTFNARILSKNRVVIKE